MIRRSYGVDSRMAETRSAVLETVVDGRHPEAGFPEDEAERDARVPLVVPTNACFGGPVPAAPTVRRSSDAPPSSERSRHRTDRATRG